MGKGRQSEKERGDETDVSREIPDFSRIDPTFLGWIPPVSRTEPSIF